VRGTSSSYSKSIVQKNWPVGVGQGSAIPSHDPSRISILRPRLAKDVGRIYEDRHSRPELRWFWPISVYVNPMLGITTSGRAQSLDEAKAQFLASWEKCRGDSTLSPRPST
jgi:hypothetical protein